LTNGFFNSLAGNSSTGPLSIGGDLDRSMQRSNASAKLFPSIEAIAVALSFGAIYGNISISILCCGGVSLIFPRTTLSANSISGTHFYISFFIPLVPSVPSKPSVPGGQFGNSAHTVGTDPSVHPDSCARGQQFWPPGVAVAATK